ncbi:unnamed protein product [Gongylonema pulchrum]|uniref:WW domain-containing protein n=1 Tax=Gongylonema pulchrum TaxID=637853 RepID=A0A183DWV1_9BILA|nr:unnamed protein product [Gongylonema pulchrum]
MPLPPALLARLKRRGIVQDDASEEVIAENYDADVPGAGAPGARKKAEKNASGAPGCPNKWNPYHYCVQFCYDRWKDGTSENRLSSKYLEQRAKILRKYPLPNGWKEVYDAGCARHYYWCPRTDEFNFRSRLSSKYLEQRAKILRKYPLPNVFAGWKEVYDAGCARHYYWCPRTDEVSWLPPRHPLAVIGDAAPKLAKELYEKGENTNGLGEGKKDGDEKKSDEEKEIYREDRGGTIKRQDGKSRRKRQTSGSEGSSSSSNSESEDESRPELSDRDKLKRAKRKGIDPMDPAAYGDNVPVYALTILPFFYSIFN